MNMDVYITDVAAFLPNKPIDNEGIVKVLGITEAVPTKTRNLILARNKIQHRYYAIDPGSGSITHTNAQLTAETIRRLQPYEEFSLNDIECLSCGTSTPDQLIPGHGLMVHGELGGPPYEVVTTAGACLSGMTALKYAYMNVALGFTKNAVATGSEQISTFMRASFFSGTKKKESKGSKKQNVVPFDADFLRWMLSDGAGAMFLTSKLPKKRLALKINWIEHLSFAGEFETCMYAGAKKNANGTLIGWRENDSIGRSLDEGFFLIKQDVRLLNSDMLNVAVDRTLPYVMKKHKLSARDINWFLPHYSSEYFRLKFYNRLKEFNLEIPMERWFTNLPYKGNIGSASIYVILEELFHSGKIKKGDKLLCFVPESGRFSMCYLLLTAF